MSASALGEAQIGARRSTRRAAAARALAASLACALLACSGLGAPRPSGPQPAAASEGPPLFLWEIRAPGAGGGIVYLTGSIHLVRQDSPPLPALFDAAFERADVLVLEIDPAERPEYQIEAFMDRSARLPPGVRLRERLAPEVYERVQRALAHHHLPAALLEAYQPWYVAFLLSLAQLREAGYASHRGVEARFLERARRAGVPLEALETIEEQISVLTALSPKLQQEFLLDNLMGDDLSALDRLVEAWWAGDTRAFEAIAFERLRESPEARPMYDAVYFQRNRKMTQRLRALLDAPRVAFVVVGSGHVVGSRGIPTLLARAGYRVRQLGAHSALAPGPRALALTPSDPERPASGAP